MKLKAAAANPLLLGKLGRSKKYADQGKNTKPKHMSAVLTRNRNRGSVWPCEFAI